MTWRPLVTGEDPPPTSVRSSLAQVARRLHLPEPSTAERVFDQWPVVVGKEVADHCIPTSLIRGVLVVTAQEARWATQLKWLAPQLVKKVNTQAQHDLVERIEIHLAKGASPK